MRTYSYTLHTASHSYTTIGRCSCIASLAGRLTGTCVLGRATGSECRSLRSSALPAAPCKSSGVCGFSLSGRLMGGRVLGRQRRLDGGHYPPQAVEEAELLLVAGGRGGGGGHDLGRVSSLLSVQ